MRRAEWEARSQLYRPKSWQLLKGFVCPAFTIRGCRTRLCLRPRRRRPDRVGAGIEGQGQEQYQGSGLTLVSSGSVNELCSRPTHESRPVHDGDTTPPADIRTRGGLPVDEVQVMPLYSPSPPHSALPSVPSPTEDGQPGLDDASCGSHLDCLEQPESQIEEQKQVPPAHDAALPLPISNSSPQIVSFGGETLRVPTTVGEVPEAETDISGFRARPKPPAQEGGPAPGSRPVAEEGLAPDQRQTPGRGPIPEPRKTRREGRGREQGQTRRHISGNPEDKAYSQEKPDTPNHRLVFAYELGCSAQIKHPHEPRASAQTQSRDVGQLRISVVQHPSLGQQPGQVQHVGEVQQPGNVQQPNQIQPQIQQDVLRLA